MKFDLDSKELRFLADGIKGDKIETFNMLKRWAPSILDDNIVDLDVHLVVNGEELDFCKVLESVESYYKKLVRNSCNASVRLALERVSQVSRSVNALESYMYRMLKDE